MRLAPKSTIGRHMKSQTKRTWRKWLVAIITIVLLLGVGWWWRHWLFPPVAAWLDVASEPVRAEYVFVLPGDEETRPFVAAALVRKGWAHHVLVPQVYVDPADEQITAPAHEVIAKVLQLRGVPEERITILQAASTSTFEDVAALDRFLQSHSQARVLVVTSNFHTRRTAWVLSRALGPRFQQVHLVGTPYERLVPEQWWTSCWGFQAVTSEYLKLLYYALRYGSLRWWLLAMLGLVLIVCAARRCCRWKTPAQACDEDSGRSATCCADAR